MMRLAMRALTTAACTCKGHPAVRGVAGLHAGAGAARPRGTVHWTRQTPRLLHTTSFAASAEPEPPSPSGDGFEEVPYSRELLNTVTITGNLGVDVELKYYENSTKSATLPVAIGRRDKPATWVDVVTWNELAEKAQQSLTKGTKIQVQGYLNQSGNGRLQVVARSIRRVARTGPLGEEQASRPPRQSPEEIAGLWMNFFEDPSKWRDYREDKANGTVKPRHPDFKMVEGGMSAPALWISSSPSWVKDELKKLDSQSSPAY